MKLCIHTIHIYQYLSSKREMMRDNLIVMKKSIVIPLIAVLVVAAGLVYVLWPNAVEAPQGKVQSIESYLQEHISELSTEPAVLGGTFYVTAVDLMPTGAGRGTGVVAYEDGHVAYIADFSYSADDFRGIEITNFVIRK